MPVGRGRLGTAIAELTVARNAWQANRNRLSVCAICADRERIRCMFRQTNPPIGTCRETCRGPRDDRQRFAACRRVPRRVPEGAALAAFDLRDVGRTACRRVARRGRIGRQVRGHRAARGLVGVPFVTRMQRRDRHEFAALEADQRRVDQVGRRHHDFLRQMLERQAGRLPEIGGGRAGQHGLHLHALVGEFVVQRLAEREHERLRAAVHAVQRFRRDRDDRRNIDHRTAAAGDEAGHRRVGEARERRHVQVDHPGHRVDVAVEQRRVRADARIVHEQRDARILLQLRLDGGEGRAVVEVGVDDLDAALRVVRDAIGEGGQPVAVAGDQDQVVTAAREAVRVDGADARRGAGNEGGTAMCLRHDVLRFDGIGRMA